MKPIYKMRLSRSFNNIKSNGQTTAKKTQSRKYNITPAADDLGWTDIRFVWPCSFTRNANIDKLTKEGNKIAMLIPSDILFSSRTYLQEKNPARLPHRLDGRIMKNLLQNYYPCMDEVSSA